MPMSHARSLRAYRFFVNAKRDNRTFTFRDVMTATGWSQSTVKTYFSKKWRPHIHRDGDYLQVHGFDGFTEDDFIQLHTQNTN